MTVEYFIKKFVGQKIWISIKYSRGPVYADLYFRLDKVTAIKNECIWISGKQFAISKKTGKFIDTKTIGEIQIWNKDIIIESFNIINEFNVMNEYDKAAKNYKQQIFD